MTSGEKSELAKPLGAKPLRPEVARHHQFTKTPRIGFNSRRLHQPRFARLVFGVVVRQVASPFGLANMLNSRRLRQPRFARLVFGVVVRQVASPFGLANMLNLDEIAQDLIGAGDQ